MSVYVNARTTYHALTADKPPPSTSKEKGPTDAQIDKAKRWRREHDAEWMQALSTPQHFASFMGWGRILGEPEPDEVQTAEVLRNDPAERQKQYQGFMDTFRADMKRLRESGGTPTTRSLEGVESVAASQQD